MSEMFVKNPMRNRRVHKKEDYVPEHKKHGFAPIEYSKPMLQRQDPQTPRNLGVLTGQSSDTLWTEADTGENLIRNSAVNKPIVYEDVELPQNVRKSKANKPAIEEIVEEPSDDQDENIEFSFQTTKDNEYILLYEDSVLAVGSKEKIINCISEALMADNVTIEEFTLVKKISLTMGIFIND